MSLVEQSDSPSSIPTDSIETFSALCAHGLLEKLNPATGQVSKSVQEILQNQEELLSFLLAQKENFGQTSEAILAVDRAIEKLRAQTQRLHGVKKLMSEISDRTAYVKQRALKLQEVKQKEAIERELKRQKELEMEELLTAKPMVKKD